jgi:hypothetical protein
MTMAELGLPRVARRRLKLKNARAFQAASLRAQKKQRE